MSEVKAEVRLLLQDWYLLTPSLIWKALKPSLIGRKSSRVLVTGGEDHKVNLGYLDSVTFHASEVLVAAGAASQNNQSRKRKELDKKIKGCGGMARKICFLRLNVKGWSSFKEFIDKEGKKDLADVEVTLGELEAELSETNVVG
ncbi:unnamed protein product [Brassica napus]|uniref:(rape) hypothetical protein n=1 Tax=Brassica napus TaxID=3708 RepID=A0A816ZG62_BRANA|nr:unnamed protein product [Brassica napus]